MRQRLQIKRSDPPTSSSLISAIRSYLPGAWVAPKTNELITLYRLRYKMALEEQKYDTALIKQALAAAKIRPDVRAEALSLESAAEIYKSLLNGQNK